MKKIGLYLFIGLVISTPAWGAEVVDMSRAEKLFLEGRYEGAVNELDRLSASRSYRREDLYYLKGLAQLKLGRFEEARASFQDILSKFPGSNKAFDAYVGMGDSYFLEGDIGQAAQAYEGIVGRFPRDRNIAIVHQRLAKCGKRAVVHPAMKEPAEKHTNGEYSVQVGYFKSKKNAEGVAKKLSQKGYDCYVEVVLDLGDKFYRAKVGRYKTRSAAEAAASALKRLGYDIKICSEAASE